MVDLILIRHGQADSAGENYDQLTETGHAQARRVGVWLAANGYQFDRFFHGGLNRQKQTLEAISAELALISAASDDPAPIVSALNGLVHRALRRTYGGF